MAAAALMSAGNSQPGARVSSPTKRGMNTTAVATRLSALETILSRVGSITATLAAISHPTESPGPPLVVDDGAIQIARTEVRPQRRRDPELRVGDLPEQEIRHAHLAAGADE